MLYTDFKEKCVDYVVKAFNKDPESSPDQITREQVRYIQSFSTGNYPAVLYGVERVGGKMYEFHADPTDNSIDVVVYAKEKVENIT